MGKTLHLFMLLALFFLAGGSISANAQTTVTFTAGTDKGTSTSQTTDKVTKDGITISSTSAALAATQYRFYANSTTTISSTVGNITKVVFTCTPEKKNKYASSYFSVPKTNGVGKYTASSDGKTGTWEGDASSFTLSASEQVRAKKIEVTYTPSTTGTKTKTTLAFADPANKTFNLNATEGTNFTNAATLTPAVEGAIITYSSDNKSIATVDENGGVIVTTTKEGKATITAKYAGNDKYDPATASYTITVKDPNQPRWIKTDLTALTPTDQFVIVDLTSKTAMSNDKGTTEAPVATAITLSDDGTELTGEIAYNLKWNVTATTDGAYTFYPNGKTDSWLYTTNSNNGVRVGTNNDNKTFKPYSSDSYVGLQNVGTSRYVGVYNKQDWRCYTTVNDNIKATSIAYFKRVSAGAATTLTLDENATEAAITAGKNVNVTLKRTFNDNAWNTLVLPFDLTAEQIAAAFGADAKVAAYTGATAGADGTYTLNFKEATTITANTPVFIHSAQNKADGYTFTGVEVKNATPTQTAEGFNFVGTYTATTVPVGNYFINSSNKFFKAGDDKTNIKGTRATFEPVGAATSAKGLGFNVTEDGTTTAINSITMQEELNVNAPMYNLAGQQVTKAYKGVILQNGKKFINK